MSNFMISRSRTGTPVFGSGMEIKKASQLRTLSLIWVILTCSSHSDPLIEDVNFGTGTNPPFKAWLPVEIKGIY